nr:MAG: hypothetical protein 1 [Weivirus-like virus sp.]
MDKQKTTLSPFPIVVGFEPVECAIAKSPFLSPTLVVVGVDACVGYDGPFAAYFESLPDEPSSPPYNHDRLSSLKHLAICSELDKLIENQGLKRLQFGIDQAEDAAYFESLPDKREIAVIYEDLQEEIEMRVNKVFRSVYCSHSRTRNVQLRIQNEVLLNSGRDLHNQRRERREQIQREAAQKKAEEKRKQVPKEQRAQVRKQDRFIREQMKIELQSFKDVAIGVALTSIGVLGAKFLSKSSSVLDNINVLLNGIRSVGKQLKSILKHLWFVPLVVVLRYYIGQWQSSFLTAALVAFMPRFFGLDIWSHISVFFPSGNIETQSGFDVMSKLLSVAFTFSVFKGRVSVSKVTEFCKRLSNLDRMSKGWESFLTWTMTALETLVNFVRERFGRDRIELFQRSDQIAYDWAKEAERFLRDDAVGAEIDPASLDASLALLQKGYGLKELYRSTEVGKLIDILVARLGAAVAPHLGSVTSRNNFRFEPVATFLYGKPGVGKTVMAVPFVTALLLKSGLVKRPCTSDDVTREMWQKGTSEYWQGYDRQKAIILDDAFQNRSFAGDKDNDYFNMIKMCGSFSMPLNFADIASKGKIFFASKIIFGSTNLSSIASEARVVIQEPEAVARRINYGYELFVHDEWLKDGKLDYPRFRAEWDKCVAELVPGSDPLDAFPWHIWYVQAHDFVRGSTHGNIIPLAEAIQEICAEIRLRLDTHEVTKANLDAMINAFSVEPQAGRKLLAYHDYMQISMLGDLRKAISNSMKELCDDSKCVGQLFKIAVFAAGSYFAFKLIESILRACCGMLSGVFGKQEVKNQSNRPLTKAVPIRHKVVLQSGGARVVADNVYANTYKMYHRDTKFVIGQILFVAGELALQPQHFTESIENAVKEGSFNKEDILVFRNSVNAQHSVELTVGQYLSFKRIADRNNDVEFVRFESIRAHRQVVNSFVTEKDVKYIPGNAAELHLCEIDNRKTLLSTTYRSLIRLPSVGFRTGLRFTGRRMDRYYYYSGSTTPGDCGAPLMLANANVFGGRSVMGVHCAGDATHGTCFANVVTREMVDEALLKMQIIDDQFLTDVSERGIKLQCGDEFPFSDMGSFLPIGTVDMPVSLCPKSKFYKTHLYGSIGPYECSPAPLAPVVRNWERVWPMERAVKPYSSPLLHLDLPLLQDAVHTAFKPFNQLTRDFRRDLYDFDEAVLGVPQDKFRSIPRNTAAGFPYVYSVKGGKKEFFGEDADYDLTGQRAVELRKRVEYVLASARKGVRLSHIYVDFLKDELRPAAKVEAVATRLISSAPLDYVIAWRMLFGTFSSAMMRVNVSTGMAPGICSYSDWPRVASHLQQHGAAVFDGDFKSFDSSEQPCVHDAILTYINLWYSDSEENQLARRVLWMDLVHSRHIGGRGDNQRYVYQWNHSLPSGHPFTTIINSLYSLVALIYCYFDLTGDRRSFWDHVAPLTYGDDNVCNVDDDKIGQFNQITVSQSMKRNFGMVYTSGHKDRELEPYTVIDNITFLKRGFYCDDNRWLCPLELDSFLFTHYWCKNKKLEKEILVSVLENSLEELALHPPDIWPLYGRRIADLLREYFGRETNCCPSRQSYLSLVLSRTEDWY